VRSKKVTYPNHYILKKNRKIRLEEEHYRCQLCKSDARLTHHFDENRSNHDPSNLVVLCQSCHMTYFHNPGRPKKTKPPKPAKIKKEPKLYQRKYSKFFRVYGMTLKQISEHLNFSCSHIYDLYRQDKLNSYLGLEAPKPPTYKEIQQKERFVYFRDRRYDL